jgi:hypothetical protein
MEAVFPEIVILAGGEVLREGDFAPGVPRWFPGRGYIP